MKRIIFVLVAALLALSAKSQLVLEHEYPPNILNMQVVELESVAGHKYVGLDIINLKVKIYNKNHSVYKSIYVGPGRPSYIGYSTPQWVSKYLFDSDSQIEFLLVFEDTIRIFNEDGTVLQTFLNATEASLFKVNGEFKLGIGHYNTLSHLRVYSLPGTYIGELKTTPIETGQPGMATFYPNPLTTAATLNYQLPDGVADGELIIYNQLGSVVRRYTVSSEFTSIIIDRGDLPSGQYTYSLQAAGKMINNSKFIIL